MIHARHLPYLLGDFLSSMAGDRLMKDFESLTPKHIAGDFACPYHPYLGREWARLDYIHPTLPTSLINPHVKTPRLFAASRGLAHPQVVALFPENWRRRIPQERDTILYFVNKFADRHIAHTRAEILNGPWRGTFRAITSMNHEELEVLVANWVHLHETAHRTGPMPLPTYLSAKSKAHSAGFEELRADLRALLTCANHRFPKSEETFQYILAERLIAYPIFRKKENFDALSSHFLAKMLFRRHGLKHDLADRTQLLTALSAITSELEQQEQRAVTLSTTTEQEEALSHYFRCHLNAKDLS